MHKALNAKNQIYEGGDINVRKQSLYTKFALIYILTMAIILSAAYFAVLQLQTIQARTMAKALAGQVVAFRSWVAGTGVVWVDKLHPKFKDFLGEKSFGENNFYSKNPALATRELSEIVAESKIGATFRVMLLYTGLEPLICPNPV
ncbi:MAG: hypothetical protein L0Y62_01585 [Nitrospirae bacterium]|nr:hypothetical protein [Nitrospirota bacterium]